MKKGNRVLALFLAIAMVFTSIAWDFSKAEAADTASSAEESTNVENAITQIEDSVSIDFDNIDVGTLDAAGYTSTKFISEKVVDGEVDQDVSEHWFSGDGDDTPYGSGVGTTIKGKNVGLKTDELNATDSRTFMYTPYTYEDFTVSAEIYYGAFSGIVFGEKNVYPTSDGTSSSIAVFFNNGRIHIMGAVDYDTATIMRGTSAAKSPNGTATGYAIFNNGSGNTIAASAGTAYTLNVKKTGNHLMVWISGGSGVMTIELTNSYKTGWIGIQGRCYDGDGGGFKSLSIEKVHAVESQQFDNAVMSELDDMGYSVSVGATLTKNSVADAFFSGTTNGTVTTQNVGMKPLAEDDNVAALNIPYVYENFRLEAELYHGQLVGVAIGDATSYPRQSKMLSVFFNIYNGTVMLQLEGAYQSDTLTRVGGTSGGGTNKYQFRPTKAGTTSTTITGTKETVHTMVLEVRDGIMKVWLEGYDGYLTANVVSTYKTDKISLIARKPNADGGGFKSYTITNLDAGDSAEFDDVNLTNLDAAGYTASDCADATLTDKAVSDVWFSGEDAYPVTDTYMNKGLKPSDTDSNVDLLNLPCLYDDFRLETKMYHGQVVGVAIGKEGAKPSTSGSDNGVIAIYTNGNYIELTGSLDYASANLTAGSGIVAKSCFYHYIPTGHTAAWNTEKTLVVELQDGILSVWMEGYEGILRIQITDNYATENIALIARRYNTSGNPGGGLKSYEIEKLPSTNNIGTTVDIGEHTSFNQVDVSKLDAKGFSATQYSYADGVYSVVGKEQPVSTYMFAGEVGVNASEKVAVSNNVGLKSNSTGADSTITVLNTPYEYKNFRLSTEVYWGASTGIVLGEENVYPTENVDTSLRIFFNANQIQLCGLGIDPETVEVTGGASWNPNYLTTYIFKPSSSFTVTKGEVYKLNVEMMNGVLTVWVEGYDGVLTIKTSDTFKQESIALMTRQYDGDGGGLKSLEVEELNDIVVPYTAEEFATYRSTEGYTAPTYKNYLFGGWFTDSACTVESAVASDVTTVDVETVYARFVPKYALTVKAQVSSELTDSDLTNDGTGNIRFVTTVDTLNYSKVGFNVSYNKDGEEKTATSSSNKVYQQLYAVGDASSTLTTYYPAQFYNGSTYFKACTVTNVTEAYYDTAFTVTPFWITLDGTTVNGETVVKTINQGMDAAYLKGKTALFVGDSIMKGATDTPANDFHYLSWAGRLDRYYGMDVDKVAQSGWALTSDCPESSTSTTIRGQIATQLDKASKDSYDYVMLEGGCNDVLTYTNGDQTVMNSKWGTIQTADDAVLDDTTIAGAMQDLIVKAHTAYPNAKLVYIINSEYGLFDADQENIYNNEARLAQLIKDVCMLYKEKGYDINYIDLSNTTVYPELAPLSLENASLYPDYTPDRLHPNAASYELSTPVIANFLRNVGTGKVPTTLTISSDGTTTLNDAIAEVVDGGTVYIQGDYAVESNFAWEEHGKKVAIVGADDTATLSFANVLNGTSTTINVNDDVTFRDITLGFTTSGNQNIMANGHDFIVKDTVEFTGNSVKLHGGGSGGLVVDRTRLELYAGNYTEIYGGGSSGTVNYDTNIIIGGDVNSHLNITEYNDASYLVYGGVRNGTVKGNTNITVEGNAKFYFIYGGSRDGGAVNGSTNITFSGNAYSIYGGSCKGTVDETHVKIVGGNVYQVFGGCEKTSMTGNTDVQLLGGNVLRRVYGGCYNEYSSGWQSTYQVTGHANVTIGPNVNFSFSDDDRGVFAGSRYSGAFDGEVGTVIFVDGSYDAKNGVLGSQDLAGSIIIGTPEYNYLVKATAGGTVTSANGLLYVTPDDGYTATVENATDNGDDTYTLPTEDGTIIVTFTAN